MAARPGIARHRRLTLGAFWPGGLIPRFPPPDSFALPFAAFWCPSIYRVAHGLPPIVCFARVLFFPHRVLVFSITILRTLLRTAVRTAVLRASVVHFLRAVGNVDLPDVQHGFFDLGHGNTDFSHF